MVFEDKRLRKEKEYLYHVKLVGLLYSNHLFIQPPRHNDVSAITGYSYSESHKSQTAKTPSHEPDQAKPSNTEEQPLSWQGPQTKTDVMDEFYEAIDELEKRTLNLLQPPDLIDGTSKSSVDPKN